MFFNKINIFYTNFTFLIKIQNLTNLLIIDYPTIFTNILIYKILIFL